jgi:hypothetical protein
MKVFWLSYLLTMSVPDEGFWLSYLLTMSVPDEGFLAFLSFDYERT